MSELEFDTAFDSENQYNKAEEEKREKRAQRVDSFIMTNTKNFPESAFPTIREKLMNISEEKFDSIMCTRFKDPTISLVLSILVGGLGVDRFYLGQVGLGVAKLLTAGGCGIWEIIDWFLIMGKTREVNLAQFNTICG